MTDLDVLETLLEERWSCRGFTDELGIPVHLEPEQYSTQQAIRIQGKNAQTDAAAED